jgi:hypothetical protein
MAAIIPSAAVIERPWRSAAFMMSPWASAAAFVKGEDPVGER